MKRVPDSLKEMSARLVQMLRSKDQHQVLSLISRGDPSSLKTTAQSNIGVWERRQENGKVVYVRPDNGDPWRMWADVDRIEPKGSRSRIVLIGESVARGFLLDPYFNCASALETILQTASADDIEIVDLARSGLAFNDLQEVLQPSIALEPDVYIIFAGNNWHIPYTDILLDFKAITRILEKTGSWLQVSRHIRGLVQQQVRRLVRWLGRFSAEHKVPIIFVIPETNLMDWDPNYKWQTPLASDELVKQRRAFQQEAERALAQGDVELAASLASEHLMEPDEELNPIGFEILAKCRLLQGDLTEAKRLKEKAWDVPLSLPVDRPPRCYYLIQEVLRHEGASQGLIIVDLPKQFEAKFPHILPDRRFFFDHCHLNVEGIKFAMTCVAEKVLDLQGRPHTDLSNLDDIDFRVDRRGIGQAHIGAAFEYAIHLQKGELIKYHLMEAVRQDPSIIDLLHVMLDWHLRPYHHIKYATQLENLLSREGVYCLKFPLQTLVFHTGSKGLYLGLVEALIEVLSVNYPDIMSSVALFLKQEMGVTADGIDLLSRPYVDAQSIHLEHGGIVGEGEVGRIYLKSFGAELRFHLICATPSDLRISLTCRVPNSDAAQRPVKLVINDEVFQTFQVATTWSTWNGILPSHFLHEGINSIVIRWPDLNQSKEDRVKEVASKLEGVGLWGNYIDIYGIYGEVHEFKTYIDSSERSSDRNEKQATTLST